MACKKILPLTFVSLPTAIAKAKAKAKARALSEDAVGELGAGEQFFQCLNASRLAYRTSPSSNDAKASCTEAGNDATCNGLNERRDCRANILDQPD
eukprot:793438-Pyramimonas_sp.AAC.1